MAVLSVLPLAAPTADAQTITGQNLPGNQPNLFRQSGGPNLQGAVPGLQPTNSNVLSAQTSGGTTPQDSLNVPKSQNAIQQLTAANNLLTESEDSTTGTESSFPWLQVAIAGMGIATILGFLSFMVRGSQTKGS